MDMRRLVGRNVRRAREAQGLTQERLAEVSGFTQQYISGLEQGRRNPTVVTLYELATALSVTPTALLTPAVEMEPMVAAKRRRGRPAKSNGPTM